MVDAVRFCWQDRQMNQSTEPYLRTAIDFLLAHHVLLRSESRLAAEFPDFFTIPLPGEGATPCFPMIVIMDSGKMNPLGRLEYGAVMRHRNPLLCTMVHTAFYLYYRWNVASETPPCFRQCQQWYDRNTIFRAPRHNSNDYHLISGIDCYC
jgi:Centromere DNA-binding protein complex CBF3 subunit, domain 2